MKVLLISHACVTDTNRDRLEALARGSDLDIMLFTVRSWQDRDGGQVLAFEPFSAASYLARTGTALFNWHPVGHFYIHGLRGAISDFNPDIIHIDEDFYALTTFQVTFLTRHHHAKVILLNFQNIPRRLPWPISQMARFSLSRGDGAIAGGFGSAEVLRLAGFTGPVEVIPPGLDENLYHPMDASALRERLGLNTFTFGYVGRLVPEKGLLTLLRAAARLSGPWQLYLVGGGPQESELRAEAARLGIVDRVVFAGQVPHRAIPRHIACADVIVLPSETTKRWKEQFGRTIIEAMACGRAVIGSDSGEIPRVVGEDGLIFPEKDVEALAECLQTIRDNPRLRETLAQRGRTKVLKHYTWSKIARRTKAFYRKVLEQD